MVVVEVVVEGHLHKVKAGVRRRGRREAVVPGPDLNQRTDDALALLHKIRERASREVGR